MDPIKMSDTAIATVNNYTAQIKSLEALRLSFINGVAIGMGVPDGCAFDLGTMTYTEKKKEDNNGNVQPKA